MFNQKFYPFECDQICRLVLRKNGEFLWRYAIVGNVDVYD